MASKPADIPETAPRMEEEIELGDPTNRHSFGYALRFKRSRGSMRPSLVPNWILRKTRTFPHLKGIKEPVPAFDILPSQVRGQTILSLDDVSILFGDIVGFTAMSSTIPAEQLVDLLNEIFCKFDDLSKKYRIEKIKTLGDCYMCCAGVPEHIERGADYAVMLASEMIQTMREITERNGAALQIRIGIHTGKVNSGVIGIKKFIYDVWSDDVTIASKMESTGEPDFIQISDVTFSKLTIPVPIYQTREVELKKGRMVTHLIKPGFAVPPESVPAGMVEEKDYEPSFPESEPYVWVKHEGIEVQPLQTYLLDSQNQYSGVFFSKVNLISLKFKEKALEMDFQRKRDSAYGQLAISLAILMIIFILLVIIDSTIMRTSVSDRSGTQYLGVYLLSFAALVYLIVLFIYRSQSKPEALRWDWLRWVARKLEAVLNPHVVTILFFSLVIVSVIFTIPEVVALCFNGVPPDTPPPVYSPFESYICHKSAQCLSKVDSTEYLIAGIFLILMNATNFSRLRFLVMNLIVSGIVIAYVVSIWMFTDAWIIFEPSLKQTISILIGVAFVASIQNYRREYHYRELFLLRRHIYSNFIRIDAIQEETEQLLLNILPVHIAKRLKGGIRPEGTMATRVPHATILFASICNFNDFLSRVEYEEAMWVLNDIICRFDNLCDRYNVEKIKTNGPYYMAVAGLELPEDDLGEQAAIDVCRFALAMMATIEKWNSDHQESFQLRIGINHGPCVSGVIGKKKFSFDIWGDSVNVASRMESTNIPGNIQVTQAVCDLLGDLFIFVKRGKVYVKGKGEMETSFLEGKSRKMRSSTGSISELHLHRSRQPSDEGGP